MPAAAKQTESPPDDRFIGQIFRRASPVLTWRPALEARAERERVAAANPDEVSAMLLSSDGESVVRLSRAPTRKMIPWPLVPKVRRETPGDERRRAITRGVLTIGAIVVLFTGVALGAMAWESRGVARSQEPPTRVLATHVLDAKVDTLAAPAIVAAPPPATPAPVAATAAPAHPKAPPPANASHRGRAHHGHRATASSTTHP